MICRSARVISLNQDTAVIAVTPREACAQCEAGRGCGLALFSAWFGRRTIEITAPRRAGWDVGQRVNLQIEPGALLRSATAVYGLPLAAMLLGIAGGQWLGSDLTAALGGVAGLTVALLLVRRLPGGPPVKIDGAE